jgi:hypothetical protein
MTVTENILMRTKSIGLALIFFLSACSSTVKDNTPVSKNITVISNVLGETASVNDLPNMYVWEKSNETYVNINPESRFERKDLPDYLRNSRKYNMNGKVINKHSSRAGGYGTYMSSISGEVAGMFEFWLTQETQRRFMQYVLTGKIDSKYKSNARGLANEGQFIVKPKEFENKRDFRDLLETYDFTDKQKMQLTAICYDGYKPTYLNKIQGECIEGAKSLKMDIKELKTTANSIHSKDKYMPASIKQVIKIQNPDFDVSLFEHYLGKDSEYVSQKLRETFLPQAKDKKKRVFVTIPDTPVFVKDYEYLNDDKMFNFFSQSEFSEYVMNALFKVYDVHTYFNINERMVRASAGYDPRSIRDETVGPLSADCHIDARRTQVAFVDQSRFEFDCFWRSGFHPKSLPTSTSMYKYPSIPESEQLKSDITFYGMGYEKIDSTYKTAGGNAAYLDITFDLTDEDVKPNHLGMLIAKQLPPFAQTSWIEKVGKRYKGYVFHHGILWIYDLTKFERILVKH